MSQQPAEDPVTQDAGDDAAAPACVMSFNVSDPTGAGGLSADVTTIAAMGAHPLPVTTAVLMRDTAEVFDASPREADTIVEQARSVLEDVTIAAWKVGYLGSAEAVGAVAEVLSDYTDVPLVTYLPNLAWIDEDDESQAYHDALRELVLPLTEVLVGNQKTLTDFLLPDWDAERPPSARELAAAANEHGTRRLPGAWIVDQEGASGREAVSLRQLADGTVIAAAHPGAGAQPGYLDLPTAAGQAALEGAVNRLFPALGRLAVRQRWAGTVAQTVDGLPAAGVAPAVPAAAYACASDATGPAVAFVLGRRLARWTADRDPAHLALFAAAGASA